MQQYTELTTKLESLIAGFKFSADLDLRLERIECLLSLLGNPQEAFSVIHVGGTSGKGSVAAFIARMLQHDGYCTGLFLSPYLQILNEVCQVDNVPAKTSELLALYDQIDPLFKHVAEQTAFGRPSYFEVKLALSLLLFQRRGVEVAVIEVGLGGTLDATNVLQTDVSVLVSVGLDHTEILGDTIEQIAADKAGIIKPNGVAVCGFTQNSVRHIVARRAAEQQAELRLIQRDFEYIYCDRRLSLKTPDWCGHDLMLAVDAGHQAHNAACAVTAYSEFLRRLGRAPSRAAIESALAAPPLPGRTEQVQDSPTVILDGAHNPDKLEAFFKYLQGKGQDLVLVFALKQGREINRSIYPLIAALNPKHVVTTAFYPKGIWKAVGSEELRSELIAAGMPADAVSTEAEPLAALHKALAVAARDDVVAVTGSLFLVGDVRDYWYPREAML